MIKKISWTLLYAYVLGFAGYGFFVLEIQKDVTLRSFLFGHRTRRMIWDKSPVKEIRSPKASDRSDEPKMPKISFDMFDSVG